MKKLFKLLIIIGILLPAVSCKKSEDSGPSYPTEGLVSYFNFDDNLKDLSGSSPDGVNNGNAVYIPGKSGKAIFFNGTSQYIEFNKKTFKNGNKISVSVWFKTNTNNDLRYFVICSDFGLFSDEVYAGMAISLPGTSNAEGSFSSETWTHLVGTYDGTNIKTYINSVLVQTKNHVGNISDGDSNLIIGKFGANYWGGSVDNLFIYNKVLTQTEIAQLYNM